MGRPLLWLSVAMRPLVWFLTVSSNVLLWPFKDRTSFIEARLSPEELLETIGEASREGTLNPRVGEIAARALQLPGLVVGDLMVPRAQVVCLRRRASREELRRLLLEHTHTRFPVLDEGGDQVIGYVNVKDVLLLAWEESLFVLEDLVRPAYFVPRGKSVVDLLTEMRARRTPFGVVVDERGVMVGIVTLEDVLEELVGEIFNEHARHVPSPFRPDPDGSVTVPGTTSVRELNRELGLSLPEGAWSTVAGLCLSLAAHIPAVGERLRTQTGETIEVLDASARRVNTVRISLSAPRGRGSG
jgi:putative hemolysin